MRRRFGKKNLRNYTYGLKVASFSDFGVKVEKKRGGGRVKFPARCYILCSDSLGMFIITAGKH